MISVRRGTGGFMLADLVVALAFTAIIAALTQSWVRSVVVATRAHQARREVADEIEATIDLMTHEIRLGGFSGTGDRLEAVTTARGDRIEVQADLDGDGTCDDANERITYAYRASSRQLARATGRGNLQALVDDVPAAGFQLIYRDDAGVQIGASGTALAEPDRWRIRLIEIRVAVAAASTAGRPPIRLERAACVALRNR